ncbi:hypothetical protein GCM10020358_37860 [Amorphoplanes nipponensis]|uniref:BON domain-containing protein n=1 Tax=Actinoplanes nipponensis TaxID=135950 RepID=A0A919JKG4_9ACTN|nr:hypothetical protein [Actinoplanes nipponensis]GIE52453.1 hypothetical protein Ani05nite_59870 [Actinoplanes nipponensis]
MTFLPRASALAAVLILGGAVLSGCADDAPDRPSGADFLPAPTTTATPADEGCGDVAAAVTKHLNSDDVDKVTVEGQCTTVVVGTVLADEDTATGQQLCDAAGEVAYTGDINSVRVLSKAGTELSNGITGMKCLP